jgi:hypothetical protein
MTREPPPFQRRDFLFSAFAAALLPRQLLAAPSAESVAKQRLSNRLELWSTFSQNNQTLVARYHSIRTSSLLESPLEVDGQLFFIAPRLLVLRDAGFTGSITRVEGSRVRVTSTQGAAASPTPEDQPEPELSNLPGLRWCADRLLRIFAPGPSESLIADARHEIPRGRSPRLILRPERDDLARLELRDLTLQLDPVGGAPVRIDIAQAQGDRHRLNLGDHRQGLPAQEVRELIARG